MENEKKSPGVQGISGDPTLNESLSKLDGLLSDIREKQNNLSQKQQNDIPVLDDLIHPGELNMEGNEFHKHHQVRPNIQEQNYNMTDLLDSLETRIADELDTVIDILKETLKDSILTELKSRIKDNDMITRKKFPPKE